MELIRQNVCIRNKVELFSAEALLHLHIVIAETVLSRDFIALREVIDPLEFVETFIEVTFTGACWPQDVPFVRLCIGKCIGFEQRANKLCLSLQNFVEHLLVVYVVSSPMALAVLRSTLELLLIYWLNLHKLIKCGLRGSVDVLGAVWLVFVLLIWPLPSTQSSRLLIIEIVTGARGSVIRVRHQ